MADTLKPAVTYGAPNRATAKFWMTDTREPRANPRQPIFRDHDCSACKNGEKPCREGRYNCCSYPHARND
jgi:hypothetical protein